MVFENKLDKEKKHCSNCHTKYGIEWNSEEQDLEPLNCPFCGYEVELEDETDEVEWINKDDNEDDSWN